MNNPSSEVHPLAPFLPDGARVLMLGSFPPKRVRWSMEFFYPNLQNDMWRIMGLLFFGDKAHFLADPKHFDRERIMAFCRTGWRSTIRPAKSSAFGTTPRTTSCKSCDRPTCAVCWIACPNAGPS